MANRDKATGISRVVDLARFNQGPYEFFPIHIADGKNPVEVGHSLAERGHQLLSLHADSLRIGEHVSLDGLDVVKIGNGRYTVEYEEHRVDLLYGSSNHAPEFPLGNPRFSRESLGL
jgi:hypothetical protein